MFVLKRLALNELILGVAEGLHFPMDLKSKVVKFFLFVFGQVLLWGNTANKIRRKDEDLKLVGMEVVVDGTSGSAIQCESARYTIILSSFFKM